MNLSDYSLITCCFFFVADLSSLAQGLHKGMHACPFVFAPSNFLVACADLYFSVFKLERLFWNLDPLILVCIWVYDFNL